jgi:molybdate transport system substrate-binding protein
MIWRILFLVLMTIDSFGAEIKIAAASDLEPAMQKMTSAYRVLHPDIEFKETYGSSGNFASQIALGAPFDIFFSADTRYAQNLFDRQKAQSAPRKYASGAIAICLREKTTGDTSDLFILKKIQKISIANPEHAPYGRAAIEALKNAHLYALLKSHLVLGENVSQAAVFIQTGATQAAIVAASLTQIEAMKKLYCTPVSSKLYQATQQAFVTLNSRKDVQDFSDFILGPQAQKILKDSGFLSASPQDESPQ